MALTDRVNVEELLRHSYRDFHAKGLDYVCLRRSSTMTWKLYFFDGDCSKAPEVVYPHNHRYNFDTSVMAGAVENVLYERTSGGRRNWFSRFDWLTPLNPGASGFTFVEACRLRECGRERYVHRGSSYRMVADEIHTLRIVEDETVLFLQQYEDIVPIGVPTSTYSRGDAPKIDGLYRRFDADTLLARLRNFEERTGIMLGREDERLPCT